MVALKTTDDNRIMLTCLGYPGCRHSMWLPQDFFKEAVVTENVCENCGPELKKIKLKLKGMHLVSFLNANNVEGLSYVTCPACDRRLKELCGQDNDRPNSVSTTSRTGSNATTIAADSPRNNGNYINPNTRDYRGGQNASRANQTTASNDDRVGSSRPCNRANSNNNDTEVKCPNCGNVLTLRTLNSESNPGRQYYKCCNGYFKWADERATSSSTATTSQQNSRANMTNRQPASNASDNVMCSNCNTPARLLRVTKESENKGRQFYKCQARKFLKWADEMNSSRVGASRATSAQNSNGASRARRKCGSCGQEGHTRKTCGRNNNNNN